MTVVSPHASRRSRAFARRHANPIAAALHGAVQLLLPFADPASRSQPGQQVHRLPDGRAIPYTLTRRRRRTIGFTIDDRGLTVSAPLRLSRASIDDAIVEKRSWIVRKLDEWQHIARRREQLENAWREGGVIRYLGEPCRLGRLENGAEPTLRHGSQGYELLLPATPRSRAGNSTFTGDDALREEAERWLRARALEHLGERIEHYARLSGLRPSDWRLSNARTLWGSCTSRGVVRLNWRLIQLPPELIDYVVVHELAHLRELHHGPAFWALVERILPGYSDARRQLREMPEHLDGC